MYQVPLVTSSLLVTIEDFWKAVGIYHSRPHLINRKILVADQVLFFKVNFDSKSYITDVLSCHALSYEVRKLQNITRGNLSEDFLKNLLITDDKNVSFQHCHCDLNELSDDVFISTRIILPRPKTAKNCVELVVLDKTHNFATFFSAFSHENYVKILPDFTYRIELTRDGFMRITVNNFKDADTNSAEWLADTLFSKLLKWTESTGQVNIQSLSMVPLERYCNLYNKLKLKYGELRKIWWEKTGTDPQKFIFEDVAIASYLICIWETADIRDYVKFVDCGCGNGLLVYILNQEGFVGYGIDVRKRPIWDLFKENADLRVGTVTPECTFPDSTWLIGNHSDELTPWLPIIASKSSSKTNFFVLPCCPFDLNGKKYIRTNTAKSQYADYIDYIKSISELCSFETSIDKLRIPSTKRISLIGIRSNETNLSDIKEKIENFVHTKIFNGIFTPRPSVERVRNCTQIGKNVIEEIVGKVVEILLKRENFVEKYNGEWNKGGCVHLGDLSKLLAKDYLKKLKSECGGLQTLLRNHRYLFEIDKGVVSLRQPYKLSETTKYKEKMCWYHRFHPNGCLYSAEICGYMHSNG